MMMNSLILCLAFFFTIVSGQGTFTGTTAADFGDVFVSVQTDHILVRVENLPEGETVRLTPTDDSDSPQSLTFEPSTGMQFSDNVKEAAFRFTASTNTPAIIEWRVSDSTNFNAPANTVFTPSQRPILVSSTAPIEAYVGLEAPPLLLYTEYPPSGSETVPVEIQVTGIDSTLLTFEPSNQINFDLNARSGFFEITPRTASLTPPTNSFDYIQHGGVAIYAIPASTTVETKIRVIDQPEYPEELLVGQTYSLTLHADIPPGSPSDTLQITPRAVGCTFEPATLTLAGEASTIQFNVTVDFPANDPNRLISYTVGGTLNTHYAPMADDTIVVKQRTFDFSTINSEIYLGEPFVASVCSLPAPVNDVTLFMVGNGLTFNGNANERISLTATKSCATFTIIASLDLAQPDVTEFTTFINYIVEGTDLEHYGKPTDTGITIKKREFNVDGLPTRLQIGRESTPISISIDSPPASKVIVTPKSSQGTLIFNPSSLVFDSLTTSLWFSITPIFTNELDVTVDFEIGGADGLYYATPAGGPIDIRKYSFQFTGLPTDLYIGGTSNPIFATIDYPPQNNLEVTLTPSAADLTFTPPTLTFSSAVTSIPFTITVDTDSTVPPARNIEWVVSGTGGNGYAFPAASTVTLLRSPITITTPTGLVVGETTAPLSIVLDKEPNVEFTVTPASIGLSFIPPVIIFSPGQLSQTYQITANSLQSTDITWALSDSGAQYAQPPITAPIGVALRSVSITPALSALNLVSGVPSAPVTVYLKQGPLSGIALVPEAANLVFTPSTITFAAGQRTATFTVTYNQNPTEVINVEGAGSGFSKVTYDITGNDKDFYLVPKDDAVPVLTREVTWNWPKSVFTGVSSYPVRVDVGYPYPIQTGLSIIPRADGVSFNPSSISFSPGAQSAVFIMTPDLGTAYEGSLTVTYDISGADALHFTKPAAQVVPVSFRQIVFDTDYLSETQLAVGIESQTYSVSVTAPTNNDVVVTPLSDSVTFSPSTWTFSSSVHTIAFTVTPTSVSYPTEIYYEISGTDAHLFANPGPHGSNLRVTHQWVFPVLPTLAPGETSASVEVSIGGTYNFVPVSIKPSGLHLSFDPAVLNFDSATRKASFTVTGKSSSLARAGATTVSVSWAAKEMSEAIFYDITPKKYYSGFAASEIHIIRNPILMSYPKNLQLDSNVPVEFSIAVAPETEVTITPYGENMEFSPSTVVFTAATTTVTVQVKALVDTTGNTHSTPYYVNYVVGGADAQNYLTPANSLHWVA